MKTLVFLLTTVFLTLAEKSDIEEFTTANNLFAQSVYKQIIKTENGNFMVSPFSAEIVLALTQSGCKGETGEEIRNALHLPNNKNKVESAVKTLIPQFKSNELYSLQIANKMYVKKGFSIKENFQTVAKSIYSSDIESVEFVKNVEAANTMNKWVEERTNNKIKNLIDSGDLNEATAAVLINALYFKANWSNQFTTEDTKEKDFYKSPTDVKKVDFMHHRGKFLNYYESPLLKAQFLELPFQGGEASMVIVLPNEKDGIAILEKNLDQIFAAQHELKSAAVNVALPKFKMETSIKFNDILQNLGVERMFKSNKADLSGIAGDKGDLYVSKVAQKTFIEVNEGGVEAAAASYVVFSLESAFIGTPKNFEANHPFLFYIKIKDVIVFVGRVTDP